MPSVSRHALLARHCIVCLLFFVSLPILLTACGPLPAPQDRTESRALPLDQARTTTLGQLTAARVQAHPGLSGILPLADALDAFAARMLLAQRAERTLDVQYYIWKRDLTGTLLLEALHDAADRGVRVRLLLDDNGIDGMDEDLAALDMHPGIEVRLFNPFRIRNPKVLGFLTDFSRVNRRMHNKSFTADNQATLVGGRNVGDEYFGATEGVLFADLDVLAIGPVVQDVSDDFDRYWASASAYPVAQVLPPVPPNRLDALADRSKHIERSPTAAQYVRAVRDIGLADRLLHDEPAMEWARTRMVSDDPAKGLGLAEAEEMLTFRLGEILGSPDSHVELVSPYFVPAQDGTDAFIALAQRGVRLRILTNSLAATDVAAVHSGYAKRRRALLAGGLTLYEMRRMASQAKHETPGILGSSGSSLHAKTFAVDGERVFVGSFNFDPRSDKLNTELGFVIDSPALARRIDASFANDIPANAYEARLDADGKLYWLEQRGGETIRHDTEPDTRWWQRAGVALLSLLPVDWLL